MDKTTKSQTAPGRSSSPSTYLRFETYKSLDSGVSYNFKRVKDHGKTA